MARPKSPARATIIDVAERAGVSTATVSRVINQIGPVALETISQVQAAIAELNYRPHSAARMLVNRKTNTLGLLLPEIGGNYFPPLLRGVEAEARAGGFGLLIYATQDIGTNVATSPQLLDEQNTDGLLVFTNSLSATALTRLNRMHFPVVLLHHPPPVGLDIPCVTVENKVSVRNIINHLIEVHGYHRIAFLRGPEGNKESGWREMGYRESLAAHGIPFDPDLVATGGFDDQEAQRAVEDWLRRKLDIDAIFAGNDDAAAGALTALQAAGKRVPGDIALVGFDDAHLSRYLTPPLTTVRVPIEQVGREAVRQLIQLIQTNRATPMVCLPTELVIRRSCGCV